MKQRVNGFRLVTDLEKSKRALLAVEELERENVAQQADRHELECFLSGKIPFAECTCVPAELRPFESMQFYGTPKMDDGGEYLTEVEEESTSIFDLVHLFGLQGEYDNHVDSEPSMKNWEWPDEWGELQPAVD